MIQKKELIPYLLTVSGDTETPITIYQKYIGDEVGILLESAEQPKGRYSFLAKNPVASIKGKDDKVVVEERGKIHIKEQNYLDVVKEYMLNYKVNNTTEIPFVGGSIGTISYDIIRQYETLPDNNNDDLNLPDMHQMIFTEVIAYDHIYQKIVFIVLEEDNHEGKIRAKQKQLQMQNQLKNKTLQSINKSKSEHFDNSIISNMSKDEFISKVNKAKEYIKEGHIFQVVLSQRWTIDSNEDPFILYRKLRQLNPSAYLFFLNFGDYQVAGSSPELLVEVRKDKIYTCPIAGTRKRGTNQTEDEILAKQLKEDEKEQAEHVMLVDLGRNDMGRVSQIGTVEVQKFMNVKYYSHVMHMVSLITGQKKQKEDIYSILAAFLPAGTLSGAPKIRAMEIIEELEPCKRGIYGGAVGYFGFDENMDTCIAIRTMIINSGRISLQAGAGIVADSNPLKEYEETENKVKALMLAIKEEMI